MNPTDPAGRLAALEKEVAALRAEIEALRVGRATTIRASGRCPACGGDSALHVTKILEEAYGSPKPLALSGDERWSGRTPIAPFEVYACVACGFVEWYVSSFEGVKVDGKTVREISATEPPEGGPYR